MDNFNLHRDPTLEAADKALVDKFNEAQEPRLYLGMSEIGEECERKLWYNFRWASKSSFDANAIKRFEDGHKGEDIMAERLRMVPGVNLTTKTPDGEQIGFSDLEGHYSGHMDGVIEGLYQAPKTPHVWEHKVTNEAKVNKLAKLRDEHGEKQALEKWDGIYHAQAISYMYYAKLPRHYLTVSAPGSRGEPVSCRTNADTEYAKFLRDKAERIIHSTKPLDKISQRPEWYVCKMCKHQEVCHKGNPPEVNCRTCLYSEPNDNGLWDCKKHSKELTGDEQRLGCESHLFNPNFFGYPHRYSIGDNYVTYRYKIDGEEILVKNVAGGGWE